MLQELNWSTWNTTAGQSDWACCVKSTAALKQSSVHSWNSSSTKPGIPTPQLSRGYPARQTTVSTCSSPGWWGTGTPFLQGKLQTPPLAPLIQRCLSSSKHLPHSPASLLLFVFVCMFVCWVLDFVGLGSPLGCTWGYALGPQQWRPEKHSCLPTTPHTAALLLLGCTGFLAAVWAFFFSLSDCVVWLCSKLHVDVSAGWIDIAGC